MISSEFYMFLEFLSNNRLKITKNGKLRKKHARLFIWISKREILRHIYRAKPPKNLVESFSPRGETLKTVWIRMYDVLFCVDHTELYGSQSSRISESSPAETTFETTGFTTQVDKTSHFHPKNTKFQLKKWL